MLVRFLIVVLTLLLGVVLPAQARRVALVIGNDNYQKVTKLDRAGNDSEAVAKELEAAGFEVSLYRDLTNTKFAVVVSEFYDKVKKGDDVVVYYAGHGVQTERGAQLLPVDIEGETEFVVERLSQPVNGLLDSLERLQTRMALVIIDACRDNPLRSQGRFIGASRGLSGPNVARGQMVMFSAASRERALDSLGKDDDEKKLGVFTRVLVKHMRSPGVSFEVVAKRVQEEVASLAASINVRQRPLIVNDSIGDFAFYPGNGSAVAGAPADAPKPPDASQVQAAREDRFWDGVVKADTLEAYRGYLERYPKGEYVLVAREMIAKLSERPQQLAQNTRGATAESPPAGKPAEPAVQAAPAPSAPPVAPSAPAAAPQPAPRPAAPPPPAPVAESRPAAAPASPVPAPAGAASAAAPGPAPAVAPAPPPAVPEKRRASYALANGDRYEGDVVADKRTGRGVYRFANGDRYEGEFLNDQFMGQGVMTFANGDRYEGNFQGTTKQGKGVMVFANKDRYEGDFADNQYHGNGTFTFASGERYTGGYVRGVKQGRGEQIFVNKDRYVGPFDNDKPHGKGVTQHANGDVYEGDFVAGVKQGNGVYRFANGDRYEGGFVDNLFNGKGRLYLASGDRYEGDFRNNVKEGLGVHYFANRDRYEGPFKNGVQHGLGTHFFANGDRYVGEFAGGVRHGKGVHHFAGGQTREMEYVKGVEKAP